jgi:gluconokinase
MTNKNHKTWFLGIDLGTGSCKSIIVDEMGNVLGFGVGSYRGETVQNRWKEQDPEALLEGLISSIKDAIEAAKVPKEGCAGLSIGGALHSLLAVDDDGRPLTGIMTWADDRAILQAERIKEFSDSQTLYQNTGCPPHGMYPLYKIIWLREKQPDIFKETSKFVSAKEYVTAKLTGKYVVDFSLASGSALLNPYTLDWNSSALELAGIEPSQLSQLAGPTTIIDGIHQEIAMKMGVPSDIPFILGSSDAVNSNLGGGAVESWQATCMIGTSGAFRIISDHPLLDDQARTWCYCVDENHWLVGGAINNGGVALAWLRDMVNRSFLPSSSGDPLSFNDLTDLAEQAHIGADGLICLPFFAGERSPYWNLNARALFIGLTLQHDLRHMARAILEGVAYRMRSIADVLKEMSVPVTSIHASGGYTRSSLWLQIVASVLNNELLVPNWGETSSLGAAFWGMLGTGKLSSIDQIGRLIQISQNYKPRSEEAKKYDDLYRLYSELYQAMSPFYEEIAHLQE